MFFNKARRIELLETTVLSLDTRIREKSASLDALEAKLKKHKREARRDPGVGQSDFDIIRQIINEARLVGSESDPLEPWERKMNTVLSEIERELESRVDERNDDLDALF